MTALAGLQRAALGSPHRAGDRLFRARAVALLRTFSPGISILLARSQFCSGLVWNAQAIHLKLDELIRSSKARNTFADLEDASDAELAAFKEDFRRPRQDGTESGEAAERAHQILHEDAHRGTGKSEEP